VSAPRDEIELFLCEDIEDGVDVQKGLDRCRGNRPRLRIVGQARTFDQAKDMLFDLERFPDIVLVDHHLRRGAAAKPQPSALELASFVYSRRRRDDLVPYTRLVLWTAANDDQLFWTFRVCGGRHVMSKALNDWPDRADLLYAVMAGAEWWPPRPSVHLTPSVRAVIRHFAIGTPPDEIARMLNVDAKAISARADELRKAVRERFETYLATGAHAHAQKAREDGWVWVDPRDEPLLPSNPPLPLVLDPEMIPRG
jgi:hypothetical protein